jgi:hypothetical protein
MSKADYARMQLGKLASNPDNAVKVAKGVTSYLTNPMTRMGVDAGIGAAFGVAGGLVDKEDDTIGSLAMKGVQAAAIEYAVTEGAILGAKGYLRSQHFANTAAGKIAQHVPQLEPHKATVGKMVNAGMQKAVNPIGGKLAIGGIGMAAGMLFTMMNSKEDGVLGGATNIFAGGGLALMGSEVFDHFSNKKSKAAKKAANSPRGKIKARADKFFNTNTGSTIEKSLKDLLRTDVGKQFSGELSKIFSSDDGKLVKSAFDSVMDGKWMDTLKMNPQELQGSINSVNKQIQELVTSEQGQDIIKKAQNISVKKAKEISPQLVKDMQQDVNNAIKDNVDNARSQVSKIHGAYSKHADDIDKVLRQIAPGHVADSVGNFMGDGMGKIVQQLDDLAAKEIVNQSVKKQDDVKKETKRVEAEIESKKVSERTEHNTKVTAGDYAIEDTKAKHDAQMEKEAKWKSEKKAKMHKWGRNYKIGGAIGLGAFALASVMDTGEKLEQKKDVTRMTEQQERNLTRKMNREKKEQDKYSYGYLGMGDIVGELFDNRIGHHKMGNAKFQ